MLILLSEFSLECPENHKFLAALFLGNLLADLWDRVRRNNGILGIPHSGDGYFDMSLAVLMSLVTALDAPHT